MAIGYRLSAIGKEVLDRIKRLFADCRLLTAIPLKRRTDEHSI